MAAERIEPGTYGLYYLIDGDDLGVFIAATSEQEARQYATVARLALRTGMDTVPKHILHEHVNGGRITIPIPDGMTAEQMRETVNRLQDHLRQRFAA